jgi:hypothetical protein
MKYLGVQIDNKSTRASELDSKKNRQEDEFFGTNLEKANSPHQDDDK